MITKDKVTEIFCIIDDYQNCIRGCFHKEFPNAVSYNRFVELMPRVFCKMMLFMNLYAFGKLYGDNVR